MKPLGDAFIRMITMIITLVIFCTLVTGIAGMEDMKKVGRVGGKALLYFEVVSTIALLIGLVVGNLVHPGSGFNIDPTTLDARAVADYAGQAKAQSITDFLVHIIPNTVVDAFSKRRHSAGPAGLCPLRFCSFDRRAAMQTSVDVLDSLHARGFRRGGNSDALRPHWCVRRDGLHDREIWAGLIGPARQS